MILNSMMNSGTNFLNTLQKGQGQNTKSRTQGGGITTDNKPTATETPFKNRQRQR